MSFRSACDWGYKLRDPHLPLKAVDVLEQWVLTKGKIKPVFHAPMALDVFYKPFNLTPREKFQKHLSLMREFLFKTLTKIISVVAETHSLVICLFPRAHLTMEYLLNNSSPLKDFSRRRRKRTLTSMTEILIPYFSSWMLVITLHISIITGQLVLKFYAEIYRNF